MVWLSGTGTAGMARLSSSSTTTTFSFKPNSLSSLSSSFNNNNHLFTTLRLNYPTSSSFHLQYASSSVSARYGGGGGGSFSRPGSGDFRRSREDSFDDDQALDISGIRSENVRLIDEKQNMIGVVSKSEAIRRADDAELDLVILSPDADPPVVRLMDYNKFKYEQQKKKRDQQKKSAASRMDLKELKMGYNIDVHDYSVRLKAAQKFLKDGNKVKVIVNLKGRESDFRNNAIELLRRFQNDIGELAVEESKSFRDKSMTLVLVPNKAALLKAPEPPKKKEKTASELPATSEVSAGV